ncbi:hypothetical protein HTZ77_43955 [Nonomuraea sp. SMC257]|uniref:Peptidase M11 gametolysin domain-containing protein n=1 Tax=Nonomuraea montanisoli TaxID=2741721 RepID=A0A7Y6IIJ3_9ACTN|nr:hypothetical protein [Nonomuraea montanisoli]NUW38305.1 hypothetical protein [Nonomuraea montanisoli]
MRRSITFALAALFAALLLPARAADATPVQGYLAWSILLCKFSDRPVEPQPPSYFEEFFLPAGKGQKAVFDFVDQQSRGRSTTAGSVVKGWYTMPYTWQQSKDANRAEKIEQCVRTVKAAGYTPPADHRIAVMLNAGDLDSGASGTRIVLDSAGWKAGLGVHEFMHAHGLGHSFSNDLNYRNAEWSQPGEYDDPWDIMSAQNHYGPWTGKFSYGAVGFNGPHLDEVGWLPSPRVITAGQDGRTRMTVQLAPLERQDLPGPLLLRVPFDPNDLNHYYTVEFRKKTGVSEAIPRDIALIHEVDKGKTILLRDLGNREPAQSLNANGVTIRIDSVTAESATVTATTYIATKCLAGYVFRDAVPEDKVCVTPATREQAAEDNLRAPSRVDNNGKCIFPYTHRLVVPTDTVCVSSATRVQVILDNRTAADRINPTKHFFGPNTCKVGYVWRGADDSDQVCVTGQTHDQTQADNNAAASRWTNGPYGPQTCISGYVWREAFIGDKVCVTGAVRAQAREDNKTAADRVDPPWD